MKNNLKVVTVVTALVLVSALTSALAFPPPPPAKTVHAHVVNKSEGAFTVVSVQGCENHTEYKNLSQGSTLSYEGNSLCSDAGLSLTVTQGSLYCSAKVTNDGWEGLRLTANPSGSCSVSGNYLMVS